MNVYGYIYMYVCIHTYIYVPIIRCAIGVGWGGEGSFVQTAKGFIALRYLIFMEVQKVLKVGKIFQTLLADTASGTAHYQSM